MRTKIKNIEDLKYKISRGVKTSFDDFYDSIDDCISDLRDIQIFDEMWFFRNYINGYAYIISFNKRLNQGKSLTEKQIVQLKRLAKEIVRANMVLEGINW